MSQIYPEYERTLHRYREAIETIIDRARMERARIDRSLGEGHRFLQSHDILHAAQAVLDTKAKLEVFSQFGFSKDAD